MPEQLFSPRLIVSALAGFGLGLFFFGGLWWTVRKALNSPHAAWWFSLSPLLRVAGVMAGFYEVAQGRWQRALACLLGFFLARIAVMRWTRKPTRWPVSRQAEAEHAA